MDDHVAATLPLPEKAVLLAYVRNVFLVFEQVFATLPVAALPEVIDAIGFEISHASRHLGMIEALAAYKNCTAPRHREGRGGALGGGGYVLGRGSS